MTWLGVAAYNSTTRSKSVRRRENAGASDQAWRLFKEEKKNSDWNV